VKPSNVGWSHLIKPGVTLIVRRTLPHWGPIVESQYGSVFEGTYCGSIGTWSKLRVPDFNVGSSGAVTGVQAGMLPAETHVSVMITSDPFQIPPTLTATASLAQVMKHMWRLITVIVRDTHN